jgi:23S rRNA-intervening sequence protein
MFNFEKLDVWQEAIQFADLVYDLTGDFPSEERSGLTNQMRRAAVSISSNLAEGSSRVSRDRFQPVCRNRDRIPIRGCFAKYHRASAAHDHARRL